MHEIMDFKFEISDLKLAAVCRCRESHCPDIPLNPTDAVLLELSWARLSRAICQALNLDSRPLDLGLLNTRQIGSWSAAAVPVIFAIQTDHAWFRGHVLELISRLRGKFILVAPTSAHFDAMAQELIENANAGFFPLEGNLLLLPSGVLQATKTPGKLFARFTPDPESEPGADVARHAFALVEQLETGGKPPSPLVGVSALLHGRAEREQHRAAAALLEADRFEALEIDRTASRSRAGEIAVLFGTVGGGGRTRPPGEEDFPSRVVGDDVRRL
jgi:hypothetical protein